MEAKFNFETPIRPTEEELTGLNMDERQKRRRGPGLNEFMDVEGGNVSSYPETALSEMDWAAYPHIVLDKLAANHNECSKLELSRVGEPSNSSSSW